jgi:hypothetical protein
MQGIDGNINIFEKFYTQKKTRVFGFGIFGGAI